MPSLKEISMESAYLNWPDFFYVVELPEWVNFMNRELRMIERIVDVG
jgi:hypothetical protein